MLYGYEDIFTISLAIISFIIVLIAQARISSSYKKNSKILSNGNLTGFEVARKILDENGLKDMYIVEVKGEMTDHYDPKNKVIRLSKNVFHGTSIASISIAAHEVGHAIQDKENYLMMKVRAALVPVINLVSYLGYFSIIISLIAGITTYLMVGIIILMATLLFQLVTLPVEFDASKKAKNQLQTLKIVDSHEISDVENMLNAAAFTYVAAMISTVLSILRLLLMSRRDD